MGTVGDRGLDRRVEQKAVVMKLRLNVGDKRKEVPAMFLRFF